MEYNSLEPASLLRELTCNMGSHSVTCHPAGALTPAKLVLDLATLEGCKAELAWLQLNVVVGMAAAGE